ncbi:MAG: hypothetical protein B7Y40_06890 [Gammaproteobacteria bacterium 28-57-27]|nr:MAG: hypothetical protein B7Y40_06890 [Gammaproteobacteria bacterium 28-57-27]
MMLMPPGWWWARLRTNRAAAPFAALAARGSAHSAGVLVVHWGETPSVDYYFRRAQVAGFPVLGFVDISRGESLPHLGVDTLVVIVRYVSASILAALDAHRQHGGRVALFMDDDLPRSQFDLSLPQAYRHMLWERFGCHLSSLEHLCDELWVSTPTLAERYAYTCPRLIEPVACPAVSARGLVTYFYHGSPSTHRDDIEWLRAVVELTQARSDKTLFMVIGDRQVRRLFADLPRILILHPMPWPTYRDALPSLPHHIGLAPLLATDFNHTRSPTRFYDFTRLGAVGLYSDVEPYRGFVHHAKDGWLLPNDPLVWSSRIIDLVEQLEVRGRVLLLARDRLGRS